jgi:hypothetical protein
VTQWILRRSKRYGQDRLYAETLSGVRLGYLDMKSNELRPDRPAHLSLLRAAVVAYLESAADVTGRQAQVDDTARPSSSTTQSFVPRQARRSSPWQRLGHRVAGRSTTLRVVAARH